MYVFAGYPKVFCNFISFSDKDCANGEYKWETKSTKPYSPLGRKKDWKTGKTMKKNPGTNGLMKYFMTMCKQFHAITDENFMVSEYQIT